MTSVLDAADFISATAAGLSDCSHRRLGRRGEACKQLFDALSSGADIAFIVVQHLDGGMDGLDLLRWLREAGDPLPAIMTTGEADVAIAVQALKAGAADFIEKPVTDRELILSITQDIEKGQGRRQDDHRERRGR